MEEEKKEENIIKTYDEMFKDFMRHAKRTWMESPVTEPSFWERTVIPKIMMLPPTDLIDQGDSYRLEIDVPGFKREDLNLEVTEDSVNIEAKTGESAEKKAKTYLLRERRYTSFKRTIRLPERVIPTNVKAKLENGVLEITLPKETPAPKSETHKVMIEGKTPLS